MHWQMARAILQIHYCIWAGLSFHFFCPFVFLVQFMDFSYTAYWIHWALQTFHKIYFSTGLGEDLCLALALGKEAFGFCAAGG